MKFHNQNPPELMRNHEDGTADPKFFKELGKRIKDVDVLGLGAQLAFFFLLSIFPLLIFLITLLPYLNLPRQEFYRFMENVIPGEIYTLIEQTLSEILTNQNGGLLSFGILATIWSASLGMDALMKSLDTTYGTRGKRSLIITRGMSIVLTVLLIIMLVVALALPIFGRQLGLFFFTFLGLEEGFLELWGMIRFTIPAIVTFIVCAVIYWLAPSARVSAVSVLPGAAFASVGWLAVSFLFSIYINNFGNFSATYGSIGGIILMLLWLYLSAMLLIVGGQINAVMQGRRNRSKKTKKKAAFPKS